MEYCLAIGANTGVIEVHDTHHPHHSFDGCSILAGAQGEAQMGGAAGDDPARGESPVEKVSPVLANNERGTRHVLQLRPSTVTHCGVT
jgi:hypothetical protein